MIAIHRVFVILFVALVATAGCLGATDEDSGSSDPSSEPTGPGGEASVRPSFQPAVNVSKELPGSEPMLDVAPDGTIYLTGIGFTDAAPEASPTPAPVLLQNGVWRSSDGTNWTEISPEAPGGSEGSGDNAIAVGGDGTVYYATATGEAVRMFRSSDMGSTWDPVPAPAPPPAGHRMWMVPNGSSTVHAAITGAAGVNDVWYHRSQDRGTTWQTSELVYEKGGLSTDLAVGPDGSRYLARVDAQEPRGTGDTQRFGFTLFRSTGEGPAWEAVGGVDFEGAYKTSWSSLEAGPNGTLYMAWGEVEGNRTLTHYAYSTNEGEDWSTPRPIAPVDGTQVMPWIDVRAPGELGLVHYVTTENGRPEEVDGAWYPEYVFVDDADSTRARAYHTQLTDWPVHEGRICTTGSQSPRCQHGASLLDFTWIEFGPGDRAHVAVASSQWNESSAFPVYAGEAKPFQPPPR